MSTTTKSTNGQSDFNIEDILAQTMGIDTLKNMVRDKQKTIDTLVINNKRILELVKEKLADMEKQYQDKLTKEIAEVSAKSLEKFKQLAAQAKQLKSTNEDLKSQMQMLRLNHNEDGMKDQLEALLQKTAQNEVLENKVSFLETTLAGSKIKNGNLKKEIESLRQERDSDARSLRYASEDYDLSEENLKLKQENEHLRRHNHDLKAKIHAREQEIAGARADLDNITQERSKLKVAVSSHLQEIAHLNKKLHILTEENSKLKTENEKAQKQITKLLNEESLSSSTESFELQLPHSLQDKKKVKPPDKEHINLIPLEFVTKSISSPRSSAGALSPRRSSSDYKYVKEKEYHSTPTIDKQKEKRESSGDRPLKKLSTKASKLGRSNKDPAKIAMFKSELQKAKESHKPPELSSRKSYNDEITSMRSNPNVLKNSPSDYSKTPELPLTSRRPRSSESTKPDSVKSSNDISKDSKDLKNHASFDSSPLSRVDKRRKSTTAATQTVSHRKYSDSPNKEPPLIKASTRGDSFELSSGQTMNTPRAIKRAIVNPKEEITTSKCSSQEDIHLPKKTKSRESKRSYQTLHNLFQPPTGEVDSTSKTESHNEDHRRPNSPRRNRTVKRGSMKEEINLADCNKNLDELINDLTEASSKKHELEEIDLSFLDQISDS